MGSVCFVTLLSIHFRRRNGQFMTLSIQARLKQRENSREARGTERGQRAIDLYNKSLSFTFDTKAGRKHGRMCQSDAALERRAQHRGCANASRQAAQVSSPRRTSHDGQLDDERSTSLQLQQFLKRSMKQPRQRLLFLLLMMH